MKRDANVCCTRSSPNVADPPAVDADLDSIRQHQQAIWESGDGAVIGTTLQIVGEWLAEAAGVRADESVLDVAAGHGHATRAAARRFARVTSTDCVSRLLDEGAARVRAEGLDVRFELADAEALPFDDGAFDVALSAFGVMFAPGQASAARELKRVVRSGGRIALASWTPEGFVGQLWRSISAFAPSPGLQSPALWGSEPRIVALFGPEAIDIRCVRRSFNFRYRSGAHWIEAFRVSDGPTRKLYDALDAQAQSGLTAEIAALLDRLNVGGPHSLVVPAEYLEVVIVKR